MIAKLAWILCYAVALCANAVDVTLRIATTSASSKLEVYSKDTGCTLQTERQDVTCTPKDDGSDLGQVPATFASAVINCKNMNTSAYDSLSFWATEWCAKFTYTQHMENGGDKVRWKLNELEIFPGSIVNITCVMFTRPMHKAMLAGSEVRPYFPIWGMKGKGQVPVGSDGWNMPFVLVRAAKKDTDKYQVEKHEEKLEISVDATGLPKGTKELDITLEYTFPPRYFRSRKTELKLPVADPIIDEKPTEEPAEEPAEKPTEKPKEKKSDGDAGLLAFLLTCAAGAVLAVAFFFYRRHQRIQAHEREVFAPG
eukprot:Skav223946  [mRNA]  locus=scaffold1465:493393:494450:+ [translate_table: standard]